MKSTEHQLYTFCGVEEERDEEEEEGEGGGGGEAGEGEDHKTVSKNMNGL